MGRRSNGEGSLRKLPSGKWSIQIMAGYTAEGKRIIKTFTASTKTEVQQKSRLFMAAFRAEREAAPSTPFSEWADTWYADYRTQVEESTYWSYGFTLKTLKDYFKDRPLQEIKQLDINQFLDTMSDKGLSKSTIRKCKSMLGQIFASAVGNELIDRNPALGSKAVKSDKFSSKKSNKGAFTQEEIEIMCKYLPHNLLGNSILTLLGTGLRVQELLALTKDDIAPDGSVITVNKAVKMAYRQPNLGTTKSVKSTRKVPVSKAYRPYVQYLREHSGAKFIWTSERENGLFTVEEFRNRYRSVMQKIPGIRYFPPHCCRHTYITNLQARNVPMELISALAGHEDVSTTLGYTHISFDTLRHTIDDLDQNNPASNS